MTNLNTAPAWDDIKDHMNNVSNECRKIGYVLTKRASRIKTRRKFIRGINIVVGGVAFIVAVIIPGTFQENVVKIFTAVASIALFLDGLLPALIDEEPPERLQDYAYYIRNYSNKFEAAILEGTNDVSRKAKILVLLDLAQQNINNVKTSWSWVEDELLKLKDGQII